MENNSETIFEADSCASHTAIFSDKSKLLFWRRAQTPAICLYGWLDAPLCRAAVLTTITSEFVQGSSSVNSSSFYYTEAACMDGNYVIQMFLKAWCPNTKLCSNSCILTSGVPVYWQSLKKFFSYSIVFIFWFPNTKVKHKNAHFTILVKQLFNGTDRPTLIWNVYIWKVQNVWTQCRKT